MKFNTTNSSNILFNKITRPFLLIGAFVLLCSHDLYIKMETYFLKPNQEATLSLYNGTFEKSDNTIATDRLLDASITAHGKRSSIADDQWKDQDSTITQFTFKAGEEGTYIVGVSTKARILKQTAESFNGYLKHDGVLDMLHQREENNTLNEDVEESYQKHVKAIYQVGDTKTEDWKTVLGYPIEFVPLENPYDKHTGETLDIQLLLDGQPLANQLVYADHVANAHSHSHGHHHGEHGHTHDHDDEEHSHTNGQRFRTNNNGVLTLHLTEDGIYYLRTIHMVKVDANKGYTHQSKWSTLTFEVTHQHGAHTHTHDNEDEISTWIFVLASVIIIGILFMFFRKKD
ncbi:DUF4198 domain-containing protein [Flammeovirga yaeyamensis]|uniref:DUF4198 domain-containing protein n=1 Tax=Flammeovirga yaeyamensis TaxID=367791 RepID=A0AAX1NDA4_9BACT|nr:DUF4198 domain-containing protein [Flammeovirga yaeyamensis]MBB3696571.1 putative GH25 family protein [Flammeovirga yaeyamensis]NMF33249.1 DUF4198 domain-containing protein [Flammeovirga yaeyamensis]QWG05472.1 DUF4198 domain-containing protein [Flammeovirga yaeyamensis]